MRSFGAGMSAGCWPCAQKSMWVVTSMLLLLVHLSVAYDNCQTLTTEIRVTKEKSYEYNGRRMRLICTGRIPISKCEGSCTSQVSPSVVHFPGFKKDCKCCRESTLVDKLVTLKSCFKSEGSHLVPGQQVSIYVKNPVDCHCFDCAM